MAGLTVASKPADICQRIVKSLDKNPVAPKNFMADTNVLDRIMAKDNRAGWEVDSVTDLAGKPAPSGAGGVAAEILLKYEKPFCPGGSSSADKLCDVNTGSMSDQTGWLKLTVDQTAERHFVVSKAEFDARCEGPMDWVTDKLRRLAYEIKHEINIELIQFLHSKANNYVDGTSSLGGTARTINIVDTNGNIVNAGYSRILQEYRKAHFKGKVLQFGGDMLATYMDVKALQGMSMNSVGSTLDPLKHYPFIYDSSFDQEFQTLESDSKSHGMTIPLGGVYMHEWYLHTGYRREVSDNVVRIKMLIDGMEYDYGMIYDPCGGTDKTGAWKFQLKKHYGFASIPTTDRCDGQGVNFHWIFDCGAISCSDITGQGGGEG